jgi:hypothetical protein
MGSATKGIVIAGKNLKENDANSSLAAVVSDLCNTTWSTKNAKCQYVSEVTMYMDIARKSRSTGFGIIPEDQTNRIDSIEAKLENICPCLKNGLIVWGKRECMA